MVKEKSINTALNRIVANTNASGDYMLLSSTARERTEPIYQYCKSVWHSSNNRTPVYLRAEKVKSLINPRVGRVIAGVQGDLIWDPELTTIPIIVRKSAKADSLTRSWKVQVNSDEDWSSDDDITTAIKNIFERSNGALNIEESLATSLVFTSEAISSTSDISKLADALFGSSRSLTSEEKNSINRYLKDHSERIPFKE